MNKHSIKILLTMLIFSAAVFCADIFFANGIFSSFYVCVVLVSLWSEDDRLLIGGIVGTIVLTFVSYVYSLDHFSLQILINKILSFVMIAITAGISARSREKSVKLRRMNETLELRVLARIAASEAKARGLEKQIEILQQIRTSDTQDAFYALDEVINNLKTLVIEKNESHFQGIQ